MFLMTGQFVRMVLWINNPCRILTNTRALEENSKALYEISRVSLWQGLIKIKLYNKIISYQANIMPRHSAGMFTCYISFNLLWDHHYRYILSILAANFYELSFMFCRIEWYWSERYSSTTAEWQAAIVWISTTMEEDSANWEMVHN